MNKIGNSQKYGDVYDDPGATGGGYMINIAGLGWVVNPEYRKISALNSKAAPAMGEELPPLNRRIDDAKGKDPFTDELIAEIERLRACMVLRQAGALLTNAQIISAVQKGYSARDGIAMGSWDAENVVKELRAILATAPVSQPAAQEQKPGAEAAGLPPIELDSIATFASPHGTLIRRADVECMLARMRPTASGAPQPITAPRDARDARNTCVAGRYGNGPDIDLEIVGDGARGGKYMLLVNLPCAPTAAAAAAGSGQEVFEARVQRIVKVRSAPGFVFDWPFSGLADDLAAWDEASRRLATLATQTTSDIAYASLSPERRQKLDEELVLLEERVKDSQRRKHPDRRQHSEHVEVERRIADPRGTGKHQDRND